MDQHSLSSMLSKLSRCLLVFAILFSVFAFRADTTSQSQTQKTSNDPGLADTSIKIGLLLPSAGALADVGAAMKDVFTAYFDNINSRGGIFNRKIELRFADAGAGGAATATIAQSFVRNEQIFAFVGGISAGADAQIAALARSEEIPFIGPSTLMPHAEIPTNRFIFYLLPGVAEQARALVNFAAAKPELQKAHVAIMHSENILSAAAAAAAEEQAKKIGLANTKHVYASNDFDASQIVAELKNKGARAVLCLGTASEQSSLLNEAVATAWAPHFLFLGVMTGKDLPATFVPAFKNKIFLAFPTIPEDITSGGMAEFRALNEKYKFPARHTASQLSALAASKVFVEGLTRAGKDLSREKLILALESFQEYETGVTPRITFGPNRRIGAAGAYIVTIDPEKRAFAAASGWIKAY